ncbi:MAG TPA: sigma-70 family RNA polymerase sigma factor [Gemmatimonadaceae bacterium]|jgi:RNA polymerase sigma-70 factor (ECF subfamily)
MGQRDVDRFERVVLPHLDDAYTLARYLLRDEHDAQDAVQDAVLRALRYFDGYRDGDARAWLLTIVRNRCFTWQRREWARRSVIPFVGDVWDAADPREADAAAIERSDRAALERLIGTLPTEFREVIALREIEDLSYREISEILGVPIGTVMSRLGRARKRLAALLRIDAKEAG